MSAINRIVFFGTPEFAVPTLAALVAAGRVPVRVVTQPARPAGRGQKPMDPPVARWARERSLPVSQPERVRDPAFLEDLAALAPDVAVVVAFGQIFPRSLLGLPRLGCINLHASLLPRWRGASPVQAAVAAGDSHTGVSTMLMEAGLDTGPVLLEEKTGIGPLETTEDLSRRLAEAGAGLMVRTLQELERGNLVPRPQPPEGATYAPRLTRESGRIDWSLSALEIHHRLRAYTPWPGLTAELRGAPVKILAVEVLEEGAAGAAPGTYLGLRGGRLAAACGGNVPGGVLGIVELQRPGKRALRAPDFANGERLQVGERFA
ncbi:MAG TPA: methionyl-tRNA formyltransferase [Thermoanaerobaculia bacterium]|nr:methionyl-tRNA formyltransferase [Thermoanaerobaculia bacterium]